jgi:murein DD-endopeptidase MepM/ murein hydrolase activator NlpD
LLNASVGVQRVIGRLRRPRSLGPDPASTLQTRSASAARQVRGGVRVLAVAAHLAPTHDRRRHLAQAAPLGSRGLVARLGHDRIVAVAVATIVLGASVASVSAGGPANGGPIGGPTGDGDAARIPAAAVGGLARNGAIDGDDYQSVSAGDGGPSGVDANLADGDSGNTVTDSATVAVQGPFLEDGTLLKPIAVDTAIEDGSDLLRTYKVKSGDTLVGIAAKFDVSMMTVWWANDLKNKNDLHIGQVLTIPPVTGLVVTVTPNDTLDAFAAKYSVDKQDILTTNGLQDPNLVVGQVIVIPGAAGKGIKIPKPPAKTTITHTTRHSSGGGGGGGSVRPPTTYNGGHFLWPVVGGGNYISQYFHYGHYAIDIAADYGSTVRAGGGGTVIFAGWKSNGGGYQVWIAHGSNLYTTYNHMSAITVGRGQHVGRGQQVGRIGQSGNATGPHLHFEVWVGPVWDGGTRVNPLGYL